MTTCIAGMHRSGTSMVAALLHAGGLFLGPDEELMPPSSANPEGYWENVNFVMINERLITKFGGWWMAPPTFPARWEIAPKVDALFAEAGELVGRFRGHNNWGWKDPRNSLTMPFWQRLVPDLKVVICVRNPLEVARSLVVRGDSTSESPFKLWLTYYRQLLSAVPPTQRIVTHYQSYFENARAEVRRVSDWIDLQVSGEAVDRACSHVSAGLRHHRLLTAELAAANVSDEVLRLYLGLCDEAGPVYRQVREREKAAELEYAAAHESTPETHRDRLRLGQITRLSLLESELAKHPAGMTSLNAWPQAYESELSFSRPLQLARNALRAVKVRLRSR